MTMLLIIASSLLAQAPAPAATATVPTATVPTATVPTATVPTATVPTATVPVLTISGAVTQPLRLTAADLAAMPRTTLRATHEAIERTFEGVLLHEVLKRAGAPTGANLRGKALSAYVVAEASDGYQVVFSLAELDPLFSSNPVLLADRADGKALLDSEAPFRLVLPQESRAARWIRKLIRLEVVQLRK